MAGKEGTEPMEKSQELIGILQAISIVAKSLAAKLMPRMISMRWKWMTRKIFLGRHTGAAGNCRPSSMMNTQEGAKKWGKS